MLTYFVVNLLYSITSDCPSFHGENLPTEQCRRSRYVALRYVWFQGYRRPPCEKSEVGSSQRTKPPWGVVSTSPDIFSACVSPVKWMEVHPEGPCPTLDANPSWRSRLCQFCQTSIRLSTAQDWCPFAPLHPEPAFLSILCQCIEQIRIGLGVDWKR